MLTDTKLRKVRPGEKPLAVGGVPGLWFKVGTTSGEGKFFLRFTSPVSKKRRDMGLGRHPETTLIAARTAAMRAREDIAQGLDPIDKRESELRTQAVPSTPHKFETVAREVYASISTGFKNPKHSQQWINTLETYAFPAIGNTPVSELTTVDFADLLRPIWLTTAETASRVRQRCEVVMTWCIARGLIDMNPVSAVNALFTKTTQQGRSRTAPPGCTLAQYSFSY